jgi:hypothetical protein
MQIDIALPSATETDDPAFVLIADNIARNLLAARQPESLFRFHVRNWFDQKWLGFAYKTLGALAVWHTLKALTPPPFHPRRILRQEAFRRVSGEPLVYEAYQSPPWHVWQPSANNQWRQFRRWQGFAILVWFSSNTAKQGQGSIMVYIVNHGENEAWHASFAKTGGAWRIYKTQDIPREELENLIQTPNEALA